MARSLIDLPLLSWYREEDASRSLLVNGDFEGGAGPPPAGWTQFQCSATRESGHRTGGSGSYVGRVSWDGANASGLIYQGAALVIGCPYHMTGWAQGINTAIPEMGDNGAGFWWTGVAGAWQSFDVTGTALSAQFRVQCANLAATRYIEADDLQVNPFIARTTNAGLLGGNLQLGDGVTPASFPTFLGNGKRGFITAAAATAPKLLSHLTIPALGNLGSIFMLVKFSPITLSEASDHCLAMGCLVPADYGNAWLISQWGATIVVYWGAPGAVLTGPAFGPGIHSVGVTNDGALVRLYMDGKEAVAPAAPGGAATKTGLSIAGSTAGGFAQPRASTYYTAKVWPFALTRNEIAFEHEMAMRLINA